MEFFDLIIGKINYWTYVVLMMIGLYGMIGKRNFVKKVIGMSIFQTAILLFYVSIGVKRGATIPILEHHGGHAEEAATHIVEGLHDTAAVIEAAHYNNPLPHVLMLTAIVVGVATLGVALAVLQKIYGRFGTLEEDQILERIKS